MGRGIVDVRGTISISTTTRHQPIHFDGSNFSMDSIQSTEAEILPVSSGFNLPPNTLLLVSAVVAVLGVLGEHSSDLVFAVADGWLSTVFILLQRRTSAKGSTILLVGPSDGGKSAVFSSVRTLPVFTTARS